MTVDIDGGIHGLVNILSLELCRTNSKVVRGWNEIKPLLHFVICLPSPPLLSLGNRRFVGISIVKFIETHFKALKAISSKQRERFRYSGHLAVKYRNQTDGCWNLIQSRSKEKPRSFGSTLRLLKIFIQPRAPSVRSGSRTINSGC